jgi:signal transduction histidine kinase
VTLAAPALDSRLTTAPTAPSRARETSERWRGVALVFAAWTALVLVFAVHNYLTDAAEGRPIPFVHALWWSVAEWYTWALLTPLVVRLGRRWPVRGDERLRNAILLLVAVPAMAALQVGAEYAVDRLVSLAAGAPTLSVRYWLSDGASGVMELSYLLPRKLGFGSVTCIALLIIVHAVDYHGLYRERELRAARLESALAAAQLQLLRSQLQPHFLFNTLNAIASLIPEDPRAAEEMVESLSDLLRASLGGSHAAEVALSEEMALLEHYLAIQELRFHDRLRVAREIDPGAHSARVPPLLLQPIVENAIRHGVAPRVEGGEVRVSVHVAGDKLQLLVVDDGPGFADPRAVREGIGLANTRQRLAHLYGDAATVELGNGEQRGASVRIVLPHRAS